MFRKFNVRISIASCDATPVESSQQVLCLGCFPAARCVDSTLIKCTLRTSFFARPQFVTHITHKLPEFASCQDIESVNSNPMTVPYENGTPKQNKGLHQSPETATDDRSGYVVERVYLLDDDPDVLKVVESMLQISGYAVLAYRSPAEFLAATDNLPAGVVITDQVMHGMVGIEVQRRLSARPNHFKVILVTAFSTTSLAVEAMKNGAVTVLDKPFNHQELLAAVTEAFRQLRHAGAFDEVLPPVLPSGGRYLDRLSVREKDVILQIYKGATNKSAGIQLGISGKTVEKHRSSGMRKLEVTSLASLVRLLDRELGST